MKSSREKTKSRSLVMPWALFLGILAGFVACCVLGKKSSRTHVFTRFERFHQVLCPEALFYPPASQVQILAQKRTKKELINVVIGGSSLSNGARQLPHELWSNKLAALLGPDYRVLNLGFRASGTGEFGAIIAETLLQRRRIIFVADMAPARGIIDPDGRKHRYFFWDAWYKGVIDKNVPRRAAWVASLPGVRSNEIEFKELRTGAWLSSFFYFNDFWNTVTYTHGGAIWNPVTRGDSFRPRMLLGDNETGPLPLDDRLAAMDRYLSPEAFVKLGYTDQFRKLPDGHFEADASWLRSYREGMENQLPNEVLRRRTLVLLHRGNPYFLDRLSEENRNLWAARVAVTQQVAGELGTHSIVIGDGFPWEDYADHFHLTGSGGEKMAALAAPAVRELAKQLGYESELKTQKE
jgi:hypothetical protein